MFGMLPGIDRHALRIHTFSVKREDSWLARGYTELEAYRDDLSPTHAPGDMTKLKWYARIVLMHEIDGWIFKSSSVIACSGAPETQGDDCLLNGQPWLASQLYNFEF